MHKVKCCQLLQSRVCKILSLVYTDLFEFDCITSNNCVNINHAQILEPASTWAMRAMCLAQVNIGLFFWCLNSRLTDYERDALPSTPRFPSDVHRGVCKPRTMWQIEPLHSLEVLLKMCRGEIIRFIALIESKYISFPKISRIVKIGIRMLLIRYPLAWCSIITATGW